MAVVEAHGLRKTYGATVALDSVDFRIEEGRILGLMGPNGAGKTTALNAILGLTRFDGELCVLGRDPWRERDLLMRDVAFIADVALLPRWIRVSQLLDYVAGMHPRFDRIKSGSVSGEDQSGTAQPGAPTLQGNGRAASPRDHHGGRRAAARPR